MHPSIKARHRRLSINIVPLVDVLIILLFFFVMSMHFPNEKVLNISLPKMETAGQNDAQKMLILAVSAKGTYYINNQEVSEEALKEALRVAAQLDPGRSVLLMADKNTPLEEVTFLMDLCRKDGLEKIRLQTL